MILLAILLIIGSALAGATHGLLFPQTLIVQGASQGAILGIVVLVSNYLSRQRLDAGQWPAVWILAGVAAAGGLLAGTVGVLTTPERLTPRELLPLMPPQVQGWLLPLMHAIALALLLHMLYHLRWRAPVVGLLLPVLAACATTSVGYLMQAQTLNAVDHESVFFSALLLGVPFGIVWGTAIAWFDPAYTSERWQRLRQHPLSIVPMDE